MATLPPGATTGTGSILAIRDYNVTTSYAQVAWITELMPPNNSVDGADDTLLNGQLGTELPTIPKYEAGGTMQIVGSDPGFAKLRASCRKAPIMFLDFLFIFPDGSAQQHNGWLKEFKPANLTIGDVRTMEFSISVRTVPVDGTAVIAQDGTVTFNANP